MSSSVIQPQMGYAAQASPVAATPAYVSEREATTHLSFASTPQTPRQSVPVAQSTPQDPQNDASQAKPASEVPSTTRKTAVDWQTHELVYRVIDSRSGQVVSQSPDEALLRLRAYAKQELTQATSEQLTAHHVSRET